MKYYTIDQAIEKSYREGRAFERAENPSFIRDMLNLTRLYFGYRPKVYTFPKERQYRG